MYILLVVKLTWTDHTLQDFFLYLLLECTLNMHVHVHTYISTNLVPQHALQVSSLVSHCPTILACCMNTFSWSWSFLLHYKRGRDNKRRADLEEMADGYRIFKFTVLALIIRTF